jgi:hypothetical protein
MFRLHHGRRTRLLQRLGRYQPRLQHQPACHNCNGVLLHVDAAEMWNDHEQTVAKRLMEAVLQSRQAARMAMAEGLQH